MRMGQRRLILAALAVVLLCGLVFVPLAAAAEPGTPGHVLGQVFGYGFNWKVALANEDVELWVTEGDPAVLTNTGFVGTSDINGLFVVTCLFGDDPADVPVPPLYYGGNFFLRVRNVNYDYDPAAPVLPIVRAVSPTFSFMPGDFVTQSFAVKVLPTTAKGIVKGPNNKGLKGVVAKLAIYKSKATTKTGRWAIKGMTLKPGTYYKVTFTKAGYKKVVKKVKATPYGTFTVKTFKMVKI